LPQVFLVVGIHGVGAIVPKQGAGASVKTPPFAAVAMAVAAATAGLRMLKHRMNCGMFTSLGILSNMVATGLGGVPICVRLYGRTLSGPNARPQEQRNTALAVQIGMVVVRWNASRLTLPIVPSAACASSEKRLASSTAEAISSSVGCFVSSSLMLLAMALFFVKESAQLPPISFTEFPAALNTSFPTSTALPPYSSAMSVRGGPPVAICLLAFTMKSTTALSEAACVASMASPAFTKAVMRLWVCESSCWFLFVSAIGDSGL